MSRCELVVLCTQGCRNALLNNVIVENIGEERILTEKSSTQFNPMRFLSFKGRYKILHMTWFAFFLTFVSWFNMAPLATTMMDQLALTSEDLKVLMICNVALTVPARIVIGMLLDKFGPRKTFSGLLIILSIPSFAFALGNEMTTLVISRLFLSMIGAGFVIGIRMVSEWFPPKELGEAEGIYGGFGNFGSAAAAMVLPIFALNVFGGENGWRYSIMLTGAACLIYGFIYYANVEDTPPGKTYQRPERSAAMEVTSWGSMAGLIFFQLPLLGVLGLLAWKLTQTGFMPTEAANIVYGLLGLLFIFQAWMAYKVNADKIRAGYDEEDKYSFSQVGILNFCYFNNFGSELAVVSMLPWFFQDTWGLTPQAAGLLGASFAFMNLFARPMGGFLSDKLNSRKWTLTVLTGLLSIAYFAMSTLTGSWPIVAAVALVMVTSFTVQAGEGATYAIVPLVKKRVSGQIAGMVGAYGTVGAVIFLTVYSFVTPSQFFTFIGSTAMLCTILAVFVLREPKGSFADHHHDDVKA